MPNPGAWRPDLLVLPEEESAAVFRTPEDRDGAPLSFIFGSCRYPGLFWGKEKRADAVFGPIYERFQNSEDGNQPSFFMMVGDQIYADRLNRLVPVLRADTPGEFRDRYLNAFGTRNMRRLLRSVPTYMILDDHEIEDNWVRGRLEESDKRLLFQYAISAYMSYQWLHGPRSFGKRLFYSFTCQGYPFFVLDERTQRIRDDDDRHLEDNHLCLPKTPSGLFLGRLWRLLTSLIPSRIAPVVPLRRPHQSTVTIHLCLTFNKENRMADATPKITVMDNGP